MIRTRIYAFGECMVEIARADAGGEHWKLGFAGDSYNVATYLQRLHGNVSYLTAIGIDPLSDQMAAWFAAEGIDTSCVLRHPERIPGLYLIQLDSAGERSFQYWRDQSAARAFFACAGASQLLQKVEADARLLYLSGITLSLFDVDQRRRICRLAEGIQADGGLVAFDTNYRARGWASPASARQAFDEFARHASILLPTFEDDAALYGDATPQASAQRWRGLGVPEVVVKVGPAGALVACGERCEDVPQKNVVVPLDTTGAGDSFNAAYLAARLRGLDPIQAAEHGHDLAGRVVQAFGAILPVVPEV